MQELQDAPTTIDGTQLLAFANALMGGDFAARLPIPEGDSDAVDAANILNHFAHRMQLMIAEITRLTGEIKDGKLGGVAESVVSMRPGPWRDAMESFNAMEWAITGQLRDFIKTAGRLAAGRLDRAVTVECQGETLQLKNSLNAIRDQLKAAREPLST